MNGKIAQIFKIHSDFYYVNLNNKIFECKIKETLKKRKEEVITGDFVKLKDINHNSQQAFIEDICARKNFIPRPKVANIDQAIIVSAVKEPELDFMQLNRYLCFCEYHQIKPILCFNKNDLCESDEIIEKVFSIYQSLGYDIIFTSATEKIGLEDIEEIIEGKISCLCGMSGVGKSTLINAISSDLNLKTRQVSEKTLRGTHTTRHCEIISLKLTNGKDAMIVDTPGFSNLKFDFLLPKKVETLFPEIMKYKNSCKYSDCLHTNENNCNVLNNIDKINISRYDSYIEFLSEAQIYKKKINSQGNKKELEYKVVKNKKINKINVKSRESSRNVKKQQMKNNKEYENE